jgi:HEPN domain-containing protein
MHNRELARDYLLRAEIRLRAVDVLFEAESWADVVREAQEVVELALKGFLRACGIEAPRIHDVSDVLIAEQSRLPERMRAKVADLAAVSKELRRDRELAFYGAEDLTPSAFYSREDATRARDGARRTVETVKPAATLDPTA